MRFQVLPMTGEDYKDVLPKLGLNQSSAGTFLEVNSVTGRRWAATGPNGTVAKFLRYMAATGVTAEQVDAVVLEAEKKLVIKKKAAQRRAAKK
jgi:hypothetical protein